MSNLHVPLAGTAPPVLYLSYDGLTSLIGKSQVLPYLTGLAESGYSFDVLSFEAPERLAAQRRVVEAQLAGLPVAWHPRRFRRRPPLLAKFIDQLDLRLSASRRAAAGPLGAVHCRSYVTAVEGLRLKRRHGLPFLFDMRGFWVDQRLEGGAWPQNNAVFHHLYQSWKAKERAFVAGADQIVVLADAARAEIERWPAYNGCPVDVIPCALDHSRFPLPTPAARAEARARAGLGADDLVLVYLGSLGTVYRLPEMLAFFAALKGRRPAAKFLFIGATPERQILAGARSAGVEVSPEDIRIQACEHADVPFWLGAGDLGICFITPTYSSLGVSPTKLAEYLACGLPVVCNAKVGDVEAIVNALDGGRVLPDLSPGTINAAAADIAPLLKIDRSALRARSAAIHDRSVAIDRYRRIYDRLLPAGSTGR